MYFETRFKLQKFNMFSGRLSRKTIAVIFVLLVLLSGLIWHQMSGARAATMDLINSTFESGDGNNWTVYGTNSEKITVASSVYNHTPGGSQSAGLVTGTVGAAVYSSAGIERSFKMPSGTTNTVTLSVYYRNTQASDLNLKWEIMNSDKTVTVTSGTISSSGSETGWTNYSVEIDDSQLVSSYTYVLRLHAAGTTVNENDASFSVHWDDVLLTAEYVAEPKTVNVSSSVYKIPNNNITTTTVTATVYDQNNQVMVGQPVNFTKDQTWGYLGSDNQNPTTVNTDAAGKASVTFKSDTGGDINITATAGSASDSTPVTVLYPASIKVSSSLAMIPNTTKTSLIANVLDQNGNPLEGIKVDFVSVPQNTANPEGSFWPLAFDTTDAKGNAEVKFSSTAGDDYTITAKVQGQEPSNTLSKNTQIVIQKPTTITVEMDKPVIPDDNLTTVTVTAFLKDQAGRPMNGEIVDFSSTGGGISTAASLTRSDGRAQTIFKSGNKGNYTVTATLRRDTNISASGQVITVTGPTTLTLTPDLATISADGKTTSVITLNLKDQLNNPVKGEPITLTTTLGEFTEDVNSLITDDRGQVVLHLKASTAGTAQVTGSVTRIPEVTSSTNVSVEVPRAATLNLAASRPTIPNDNATPVTVTATVYDQFDHPLNGQTVTFTKAPDTGTISPSETVATNTNGQAAIQFKSGISGTYTIEARCSDLQPKTVNVTVETRTARELTLISSTALIPDDGNHGTTLTVHLVDQFGNPMVNEPVSFTKNQTWGQFSVNQINTDTNGYATVTFTSNTPGTIELTASADSKSDSETVRVQGRIPTTLALTASSSVVLLPSGSSTITALLKDQFGMPVSGQQLTFSTSLGKLSAATAVTDSDGYATVTLMPVLGQEETGPAVVAGKVNGAIPVSGMATVDFRNPDSTKPTLIKAEPTSKQVIYLTFSEKIKFSSYPPSGWSIKKYVNGSVYGDVPFNEPVIVSGDKRIVMVTLKNNMDTGNQSYDRIKYVITVDGVYDLADNLIDYSAASATFWAFTPHGKYTTYPASAGSSTRICAQCHSNHKATGDKLLAGTTVKKVCFVCHGNTGISTYKVEEEFYRGDSGNYSHSMHAALDSDSPGYDKLTCVDCHNPHGNRRADSNEIWPKLLRARDANGTEFTSGDGNRFCTACHGSADVDSQYGNRLGSYWNETLGDHSSGMEVTGEIYKSAHYDTRFSALNPSSGTGISCVKCHERHGSKNSGLIDNNVSGSDEQLCYKCHNNETPNSLKGTKVKEKFDSTGGNTSKHNIFDILNIGLTCRSCHEPHSTAARSFADSGALLQSDISDPTNTKVNWNKDSGTMSQFCIKCHDVEKGETVTKAAYKEILVPYTVKMPDTDFANGSGWNKSKYIGSSHEMAGVNCDRCHDPHGSNEKRLALFPEDPQGQPTESSGMCLRCHGGGETPAGDDVYTSQLSKTYSHPTLALAGKHSDTEDYSNISASDRHAECYDCHDSHTVKGTGSGQTAKLGIVSAVKFSQAEWKDWASASATLSMMQDTSDSKQAYLCYKCHSKFAYNTNPPVTPSSAGSWQGNFQQTDVAKEFNPGNEARHVVEGSSQMPKYTVDGDSMFYGKFKSGILATDKMKCTDCHGPSSGTSGGPHGSTNRFILKKPWDDNTGKAGSENDLCFNCHDYAFYAGGDVGSFTERSQFSGNGIYNLHGGPHAGKGCVSCHGAVPHGWDSTDSDGGGLSLFTTEDSRPYSDGSKINNIVTQEGANEMPNTPGNWVKANCTTACHH